jgi:HAE1 family hydrophobic/amphiphilic exporter-1
MDSIMHLGIINNNNKSLELNTLSELTELEETGRIYHQNRQRSVSFSVITDPDNKQEVLNNVRNLLSNHIFPEGYRAEAGLEEKEEQRIKVSAVISLILSIIFILIILIFQFEKIKIPFIIMMQIPLSFILPVFLLFIFNQPLSLPAMIGLILTAGISVNNSILVFDKIKNKKINLFSVYLGLKSKIKAILIASLTTILGVFPLLFSAESSILSQLSLTMAAGITGSVFFLVISLPLFYRKPF